MNQGSSILEDRQLFTLQDLANRWGCSQQTVRIMCKKGELEHFKVGNRYRINAEQVRKYEKWKANTSSQNIEASGVSTIAPLKSKAMKCDPLQSASHFAPPTVLWQKDGSSSGDQI